MTISSEIKEQLKFNHDNNNLEFQNFSEIYFPHICIICRNHADKHIAKNFYGSNTLNKDYKKNYTFSLPVCDSCRNNIEMKTGLSSKSGKLVLLSTILGLIAAILLFLTLNSILLSISIFTIFIIFSVRNYKNKTKSKIKFDNHLKIKIDIKNPDVVELKFSDKEYALALEEINLSKLKLRQEQEAKRKKEQEAKRKKEQEAKLKREQEAKLKREQEDKLKREQEAKLKKEQEAKLKQEQEAKLKQEQETKLKQELEANLRQELEVKLKQELEARKNLQPIPESTEMQQIDENIENEKSPVEITITEPIDLENSSKVKKTLCPKCKRAIKSEWVFCDNCGSPLNKQSK